MNITDFLAISIVGTLLSVGVEYIQGLYGTTSGKTKGIVILGSMILGTAYVIIRDTPIFPTVLGILSASSTIFAMFYNGNKKQ